MIHLTDFEESSANVLWYKSIPDTIKEPLVEYVTCMIIKLVKIGMYKKIFMEADKLTPPYYREWKRIREILPEVSKYMVPIIVRIVRSRTWSNMDELLEELNARRGAILSEVTAYEL